MRGGEIGYQTVQIMNAGHTRQRKCTAYTMVPSAGVDSSDFIIIVKYFSEIV